MIGEAVMASTNRIDAPVSSEGLKGVGARRNMLVCYSISATRQVLSYSLNITDSIVSMEHELQCYIIYNNGTSIDKDFIFFPI